MGVSWKREKRMCLCAEQSLCLVYAAKPVTVEAFASGDAPIFVKGRQENPESSIVGAMPVFSLLVRLAARRISLLVVRMGNKETLSRVSVYSKKDGRYQQSMLKAFAV
jgi:hypothetical protein